MQYLDVTRREDIAALVTRVEELAGADWRINLINNAAVLPRTFSKETFEQAVQTNVRYVGMRLETHCPACTAAPNAHQRERLAGSPTEPDRTDSRWPYAAQSSLW